MAHKKQGVALETEETQNQNDWVLRSMAVNL